jgi:RNA polymerase sigma-70 factor (ECF subfamily)
MPAPSEPKSARVPIADSNEQGASEIEASEAPLIVAQMRPALVKFFERRCGSADEAEDLAQDVLVRAFAHATWKSPEQAKGYIFRAAVNRWRDRGRRAMTRGTTVQWTEETIGAAGAMESITSEEIVPERVLIVEQELFNVATALAQLSERARDVFMLVRLEGMKQSAVAQMLGVSVSTVEKELAKALVHLARCARQRDGT